jgi:serine/threonine protein kinase
MEIINLPKTSRSRLNTQDTYKIVCQDPDKYLRAIESFKSANEVGSGLMEFVHVALGKMKKFKKQCVIKVHFTDSLFTNKEIDINTILLQCPYVVKYICSYTCLDDKTRWMDKLLKPQKTCSKDGNDKLTFIIMEYIENGDVPAFIKKASKREILSLFLTVAIAIIDISKYNVSHGDLNSGNILLKFTKPIIKTVKIGHKDYTFNTHGIHPLFIDFGRGYVHQSKISQGFIIDDILTMFSVFINYIPHDDIKEDLNNMIISISKHNKPRLSMIFKQLIEILQSFKGAALGTKGPDKAALGCLPSEPFKGAPLPSEPSFNGIPGKTPGRSWEDPRKYE